MWREALEFSNAQRLEPAVGASIQRYVMPGIAAGRVRCGLLSTCCLPIKSSLPYLLPQLSDRGPDPELNRETIPTVTVSGTSCAIY